MCHKASKDMDQEREVMKRQEVDQALAAAWDEIEEGAQR